MTDTAHLTRTRDSGVPQVVAAVIVTHNRRDLLRESVTAVLTQSRPCDIAIVVDNASTDGTAEALRTEFNAVEVIALPRNTGGAGGFAVGIERALAMDADLLWVMDDDTVPQHDALRWLMAARERYTGRAPALVASAVTWIDGRPHPMNTPRGRPFAPRADRSAATAVDCVPIRSASFVSILIDAAQSRRCGLPQADYFLWNDDFEYTARLLRDNVGLLCPASVVVHKTRTFGAADVDPGERFFFEVRNKIWLLKSNQPLAVPERIIYVAATLRRWIRTFYRSDNRAMLRRALHTGLRAGLRTTPRPTEQVLADLVRQ